MWLVVGKRHGQCNGGGVSELATMAITMVGYGLGEVVVVAIRGVDSWECLWAMGGR